MSERRFRVTQTPEPHEREQARRPGWPSIDVIDPPSWLSDLAGMDIPPEFFRSLVPRLVLENYEFRPREKAWFPPSNIQ